MNEDVDRLEAEILARAELPHAGDALLVLEDDSAYLFTFQTQTVEQPSALVDKTSGDVEVFTTPDFDRVSKMRLAAYAETNV